MKKYIIIVMMFAFTGNFYSFAKSITQRITLVEQVSSASCPSCATRNSTFHPFMESIDHKVAFILYPHDDPGHPDPMGKYAKQEVKARIWDYYDGNYFSQVWINGMLYKSGNTNAIDEEIIDIENSKPSHIEIMIDKNFDPQENKLIANVDINVLDSDMLSKYDDLRLFVVAIEREKNFDQPPGNNGVTHFPRVMRDMMTGADGWSINLMDGEFEPVELSFLVNNEDIEPDLLEVVAFVQDYGTMEILQANETTSIASISEGNIHQENINIYPNPANDQIEISIDQQLKGPVQLEIFDMQGRNLLDPVIFDPGDNVNGSIISVSELSVGIYLIGINSNRGKQFKKLMIKR